MYLYMYIYMYTHIHASSAQVLVGWDMPEKLLELRFVVRIGGSKRRTRTDNVPVTL